jgi:hypothetical protein
MRFSLVFFLFINNVNWLNTLDDRTLIYLYKYIFFSHLLHSGPQYNHTITINPVQAINVSIFFIFQIYFSRCFSTTIYVKWCYPRCFIYFITEKLMLVSKRQTQTCPRWPPIHIRMYVYCHIGRLCPLRFHY